MKTNLFTTKALCLLAGAAVSMTAIANAGEMAAPAPVSVGPTKGSLIDPVSGVVSVGYDSHYMFRGFNLGQEAVWTGLDFSMPVALPIGDYTLSAGAWYINPTEGAQGSNVRGALDDELDLYISLGTTIGPVDVAVGYTHYFLGPDGVMFGDQNEVGLSLGTTVGRFNLGLAYYFNFDAGDIGPSGAAPGFGAVQPFHALDHYWEPSIGTNFELTDRVGLSLGVSAGWYSTEFSHIQYTASLPIQISETVVFEPYVAYLDDRSSGTLRAARNFTSIRDGNTDDDVFAGASLSVSF